MITVIVVSKIFAVYAGCWALGFGVGKSVAWTRKISSVV